MLGGFGNVKDADSDIQTIVDQVKNDVQEKTGKSYDTFKAVKYTSQVVAGMNYKIKVHTGGSDYVHIKVYRGVGANQGNLTVSEVEEGKSENDNL